MILRVLVCVFALAACARPGAYKRTKLPTREVAGRVEDGDTRTPLRGARVLLLGPGGRPWGLWITKRDGTFSLEVPVVEGHDFRVLVSAAGYEDGRAKVSEGDRPFVLTLRLPRPASTQTPPERWIETNAPDFHVISNADEADARLVVEEFESFRALLRRSIQGNVDIAEPTVPLTIYALRSEEDLRELQPGLFKDRTAKVAGLFHPSVFGVDIFVILGERDAAGELENLGLIVRHEYHHLYFDRTAPTAPLWLREGLAEIWASARVRDGKVHVGEVNPDRVLFLQRNRMMPLGALMTVGERSPEYREEERAGVFYVESMLLTHYLLFKLGDGQAKLTRFGDLIQGGAPREDAAKQAWGDLAALESDFGAYVKRGLFSYGVQRAPDASRAELTFSTVGQARLLGIKARLLAVSKPARARELIAAALTIDPNDTLALEARALVLEATEEENAADIIEEIAGRPDAGFAAHYLAVMSAPRKDDGYPVDKKSFEAHVRRIRELAPRFAPGISCEAVLEMKRNPARARELVLAAMRLEPGDPMFELRAARMFRATGDSTQAEAFAVRATTHAIANEHVEHSFNVCRVGSMSGWATIVEPACTRAMALAPKDWRSREGRAMQRAFTGDRVGAIEDLRFLVTMEDGRGRADGEEFRARLLDALEKSDGKKPIRPAEVVVDDPFM